MAEDPLACPIPRWEMLKGQLKNVGPAEFNQLLQKGEHKLLDVRTAKEFTAFHLPQAENLDYLGPDFLEQMEALQTDEIHLVYCRSGRRSVRACTLMKNAGLTNLIHLDGGLNAWQAWQEKQEKQAAQSSIA
ncbi:MAG: rhodanese-like domain-containing protein [Bacteroidota bacterium]